MDCTKCIYAQWDYDDAYGYTIRWVEGCRLAEDGKSCPFAEENDG